MVTSFHWGLQYCHKPVVNYSAEDQFICNQLCWTFLYCFIPVNSTTNAALSCFNLCSGGFYAKRILAILVNAICQDDRFSNMLLTVKGPWCLESVLLWWKPYLSGMSSIWHKHSLVNILDSEQPGKLTETHNNMALVQCSYQDCSMRGC